MDLGNFKKLEGCWKVILWVLYFMIFVNNKKCEIRLGDLWNLFYNKYFMIKMKVVIIDNFVKV